MNHIKSNKISKLNAEKLPCTSLDKCSLENELLQNSNIYAKNRNGKLMRLEN